MQPLNKQNKRHMKKHERGNKKHKQDTQDSL